MPVAASDLKLYDSATMATSFSTATVGGAINASSEVLLSDTSRVFFTMGSDGPGGANKVQHQKLFDKNTHATDSITNYGVYLANGIDDLASAAVLGFESDDVDDEDKIIRAVGFNGSGDPITEDVVLVDGAEQFTSLSFDDRLRCIVIDPGTGAVTTCEGTVTITHGATVVGVIPPGGECATNEVDIGLASGTGGTTTIATAAAAPGSVTFSRPRTTAARLLVDSGAGALAAGVTQGIWARLTIVPEMLSSERLTVYLEGYSST